jgi:DNA-binding transcriptional LysR family regulator
VDDFRSMRRLIRAGLGFGIMPRSAFDEPGNDLVGIPGDPPLRRDIAVLTRTNRLLPPSVAGFRDSLVDSWATPPLAPAMDERGA